MNVQDQIDPYYKEPTEKITTTIPRNVKNKIIGNNYRYNELITLGLLAKENNPQLIRRIQELEKRVARLEK